MKLLTFFFAIYILILPCLPCVDKEECNDKSKTEISSATTNDSHQEQQEEACSPMCSCGCCGHIYTSNSRFNKLAVIKISYFTSQQFFYKNIHLSSDFYGNIWQPPKIVNEKSIVV